MLIIVTFFGPHGFIFFTDVPTSKMENWNNIKIDKSCIFVGPMGNFQFL